LAAASKKQRKNKRMQTIWNWATWLGFTFVVVMAATAINAFELTTPQEDHAIDLNVGSGVLATTPVPFNSIFVADETIASVNVRGNTVVYVSGLKPGNTAIFGLDADNKVVFAAPVNVNYDLTAMRGMLSRIAPTGVVSVSQAGQALILSGEVAKQEEIDAVAKLAASITASSDDVINRIELRPGEQVKLNVRIAEVSRSLDEEIGLNWASLGQIEGTVKGTNPRNMSFIDASIGIDTLLTALSQDGLVTILAEPNLSARSGETATFLAGGEFPYEVTVDGQRSVEFKDFGASLSFTPVVDHRGVISLDILAEVSELNISQSRDVPALSSRRVETSVDLRPGESLAIAGLITNTSSQNISRLPGLGSLPVVGALFRSSKFQKGKTELVVIVTPHLVRPSRGDDLVTPLDFFKPPTDAERLLLGQLEGARSGSSPLRGSAGFSWK
jgi:pilus assembly protein CpaC